MSVVLSKETVVSFRNDTCMYISTKCASVNFNTTVVNKMVDVQ